MPCRPSRRASATLLAGAGALLVGVLHRRRSGELDGHRSCCCTPTVGVLVVAGWRRRAAAVGRGRGPGGRSDAGRPTSRRTQAGGSRAPAAVASRVPGRRPRLSAAGRPDWGLALRPACRRYPPLGRQDVRVGAVGAAASRTPATRTGHARWSGSGTGGRRHVSAGAGAAPGALRAPSVAADGRGARPRSSGVRVWAAGLGRLDPVRRAWWRDLGRGGRHAARTRQASARSASWPRSARPSVCPISTRGLDPNVAVGSAVRGGDGRGPAGRAGRAPERSSAPAARPSSAPSPPPDAVRGQPTPRRSRRRRGQQVRRCTAALCGRRTGPSCTPLGGAVVRPGPAAHRSRRRRRLGPAHQ